jgi:hypothetical protein
VQLADVIAGTAVACLANGAPEGFEATVERLERHILPDTILPDYDIIDLEQRVPAVNYLMLIDLAQRAETGSNPYMNLAEMYHAAEVSWARGDYHALREGSAATPSGARLPSSFFREGDSPFRRHGLHMWRAGQNKTANTYVIEIAL